MGEFNKKKLILVFVAAGAIGMTCLLSCLFANDRSTMLTSLKRPEPGGSFREYELEVLYEGHWQDVTLTVNERELTFEEAEERFEKICELIVHIFEEENGDLNKISNDLYLPETVASDELAEITWYSGNTDFIENDGTLTKKAYTGLPEEGIVVIMYAKVYLQEYSATFEIPVYLSEKYVVAGRSINELIAEELEMAEQKNVNNQFVFLPEEIGGIRVSYYEAYKSDWWKYPFLLVIVLAAYLFAKRYKENKAKEERIRQLELAYTPIITKFALLIGAGSSIRGALERLASDYRAGNGKGAAYEEIQRACNEMKNGMSEQQAYEAFGKRCRLSMYVRFANLLEQNLRKGTKGLSERLSDEVREAFENRKALAIRLGEEAGTKLLLPMIMLLIVVIVICVVPAFLSM